MPGYETLLVEHDGPVGWLVFNRPDGRQRDERHDDGGARSCVAPSSMPIPTCG